jgi:hypothetical protein
MGEIIHQAGPRDNVDWAWCNVSAAASLLVRRGWYDQTGPLPPDHLKV